MSKLVKDLTENDVIHCSTKSLFSRVKSLTGFKFINSSWDSYREAFCVRSNGSGHSNLSYYKGRREINIIKAEDLLAFNGLSCIVNNYELF